MKYTVEQLELIIGSHKKWLRGDTGGVMANLRGADLSRANLSGADLSRADLSGANLSGANLRDLLGNQINVKTVAVEKYTITYTSEYLQIGCQRFTIREWFNFSDDEISKMDCGALGWWNKWKLIIKTIIEISPAEPTK